MFSIFLLSCCLVFHFCLIESFPTLLPPSPPRRLEESTGSSGGSSSSAGYDILLRLPIAPSWRSTCSPLPVLPKTYCKKSSGVVSSDERRDSPSSVGSSGGTTTSVHSSSVVVVKPLSSSDWKEAADEDSEADEVYRYGHDVFRSVLKSRRRKRSRRRSRAATGLSPTAGAEDCQEEREEATDVSYSSSRCSAVWGGLPWGSSVAEWERRVARSPRREGKGGGELSRAIDEFKKVFRPLVANCSSNEDNSQEGRLKLHQLLVIYIVIIRRY